MGSTIGTALLKALRLYSPELFAPAVLAGGARRWGSRELFTSYDWTPGQAAAGGSVVADVPLADCRPGDLVEVGYSVATVFPLDADTANTGAVRIRFRNDTGTAQTPPAGRAFIRAVKPRL